MIRNSDMNNLLIGIAGPAGSGKNTVATILQGIILGASNDLIKAKIRNNTTFNKTCPLKQKSYAKKLKRVATILTGIPLSRFENQKFKKKTINADLNITVREFLQKLGTEAIRDNIHEDIWVNALFTDYKTITVRHPVPVRAAGYIDQEIFPNWVITDVRFPNEAQAIKKRGGRLIKILRDNSNMRKHTHISENLLDSYDFEYTIENNGNLDDLIATVQNFYTTKLKTA